MEAAVSFKEVGIPDAIMSGMAGTGHEYLSAAGTRTICTKEIPGRDTTGTGMPPAGDPGRMSGTGFRAGRVRYMYEDPAAWYGDPAFPLTGGLEKISVRLDKKIDRQGKRLLRVEERGKLP